MSEIILTQGSTPSAPNSGKNSVYIKNDGYLYTLGSDNIERFVGSAPNGWIPIASVPVYVSSTSVSFNGIDLSTLFPVGTKIKLTQTTDKYFYVASVTYGSGNTTLTLIAGTSYTVANATITGFWYSHGLSYNFPEWLTYVPTWIGSTTNPAIGTGTLLGRFNIIDRLVTVAIYVICTSNTTYGSGNYTFALPITPSTNVRFTGMAVVEGSTYLCVPQILSNVAYIQYYYRTDNAGLIQFSPTIPKTWNNGTVAFINIQYSI